jgi:transposase
MRPTREWQGGQKFIHHLPSKGRKSFTIIGAISNEHEYLQSKVIKSTNKKDCLAFFKTLVASMHDPARSLLIMDNHASHHSHVVTDYLLEQNVKTLFTPPGGSSISSIEYVWSILKGFWRREMIKLGLTGKDHQISSFQPRLVKMLKRITPNHIKNLRYGMNNEVCRVWRALED